MAAPASAPAQRTCRCVVIGDGTVGKTCMLSVYARKGFPAKYIPTIFDNYSAKVDVDGSPIQLVLWDTAGQEEFDKLRPLSYPNTHVFIICFAVDSPTTYANVKEKWYGELRPYLPNAQIILVGTKSDLRTNSAPGTRFVTSEQGEMLRAELGAYKYVECSAMQNVNVKTVFDEAIRARFTMPDMLSPVSGSEASPKTLTTPAPEASRTAAAAPAPPPATNAPVAPVVKKKKKKSMCCIL